MYTITYELYGNDYTRKEYLKKSFNQVEDLHEWIVENAIINIGCKYEDKVFYPYGTYSGRISFKTQKLNQFMGYRHCDCWIHKIESDRGIEFTDGAYTQGQKHKSELFNKLFDQWYKEDSQPKVYNFAK